MCHFRLISRSSSWFMVWSPIILGISHCFHLKSFKSLANSFHFIHCSQFIVGHFQFGWFGFILPLEKPFSYIHIIIVIAIVVSLISSSVTFYITVTNANANTCIGLLSTHTHNPPRFALNNNNNTQCHSKESIKVSQLK